MKENEKMENLMEKESCIIKVHNNFRLILIIEISII